MGGRVRVWAGGWVVVIGAQESGAQAGVQGPGQAGRHAGPSLPTAAATPPRGQSHTTPPRTVNVSLRATQCCALSSSRSFITKRMREA